MSIFIIVVALIWGGAFLCSLIAGCLCAIFPRVRQDLWGERTPPQQQHRLTVRVTES